MIFVYIVLKITTRINTCFVKMDRRRGRSNEYNKYADNCNVAKEFPNSNIAKQMRQADKDDWEWRKQQKEIRELEQFNAEYGTLITFLKFVFMLSSPIPPVLLRML